MHNLCFGSSDVIKGVQSTGLSATTCFVMVAERLGYGTMRVLVLALLAVSAGVLAGVDEIETVHLKVVPWKALDSGPLEVARSETEASQKKYKKKSYSMEEPYVTKELYVKYPRQGECDVDPIAGESENCRAVRNLQAVNGENCRAVKNLQAMNGEPNGDSGVQATSYLRLEKFENKSMSMCLVKGVFETVDAETDNFAVFDLEIQENVFLEFLAGMNKDYVKKWLQWIAVLFDFDFNLEYVFKVMVVLTRYGSPTMDYMVHFLDVINYFGYYVQKMFLVLVDVGLAWQSLCLTMWWLLSPHSGLGWLQLVSCLSDVAGGQVFQMAVVALMVSSWIGIMATSNMNLLRHVATPEHMSRVEKRRKKRVICTMRKQFISLMFICSCSSAAAMEQDAMLQRIISLTEAATRAAVSAEQTLNQVQGMTSSATSSSEGLQAASRILKAPDTFNGDDPMQFASWRFQFTSWLTFGDNRYTTLLEKVEAMTSSPSIGSYDTAEKELAHKLYAVLTSYLRGRCSHIIKAFAKSRDGFAIWYQLMREFEPTSRQRSLALAQALASYPVFAKDKSCLESILVYEQTVQQFEESSSTTYPDELKVATLMRCCNNKLREFLQLNIKDSSTYVEVREHIMNYERVSKSWTQEQVLKAIQQDPARPDLGGPTPMEIDRVEVKGKGKSKSKSKGKNNSGYGWSSGAWGFGRGRGRGRDSKGKGKKGRGKGKGKNKGKSKNKGKGPHKGKVGQDQCAICYGYGHWSRDCPHKPRPMEVNQVQEQPQQQEWIGYLTTPSHGPHQGQGSQHPGLPVQQLPVVSGATTASSSSFRPPSTSTGSTVRRIFHIGPPTPSSSPSNSMYRDGSVRMVQFEEIPEEEYIHVTTTQDVGEEEWVILDSGSDVSLLPDRFLADIGSDRSHALRDCQGGELAVMGTRFTDLQVQDVSGENVVLRHQFVVGDVTTSLISLGQLYQLGWRIEEDGNGQLCLKDPSKNVEIPVHYRGKSFALKAHVRHVSEEGEQNVRAVVRVFDKVSNHEFFAWGSIKIGMPFWKTVGWGYADPRPAWGSRLPYRTTLIKKRSSEEPKWTVAELSQKYMEKPVPFGDIAEISNLLGEQMAEILTIVTAEPHGLEDIGEIVEGEVNIPDVAQEELHPELPPGLQEEEEGMDLEAAGPPTAPEAVAVPVEEVLQDEITLYDGFTLTRNSKVADLRVGCQWIGVYLSQDPSKRCLNA